jgi:hypothetical protein
MTSGRGAQRGAAVVRDDRILPETRIIGALIPPFLIVAFVILYLFPNDTDTLFAWTVKPSMTPLMMGGGYISGSYFFVRLVMGGRWSWFALGFLPIAAFTWFMAVATVIHWEKFNHEHIAFYAWLILYLVTPILVPVLWLRNRATDPGILAAGDVAVPAPVRRAALLIGLVLVATAMFMFLLPDTATSVWPWTLTPLTSRVIAGWFALPGVLGLMYATDSRWGAWRIVLESQVIGIALILLGAARAWGDFSSGRAMTWVFVGGLTLLLAGLVTLYAVMESRRRAAQHRSGSEVTAA